MLFAFLLPELAEVPDPRPAQGQRYGMLHLLLVSVLGTLAGATFYQKIIAFIALRCERLNIVFGACFRRASAVNMLRHPFLALGRDDLEAAFRRYTCDLARRPLEPGDRAVALPRCPLPLHRRRRCPRPHGDRAVPPAPYGAHAGGIPHSAAAVPRSGPGAAWAGGAGRHQSRCQRGAGRRPRCEPHQ